MIFTPYFVDLDAQDVSKVLSIIGISRPTNFKRTFHCHNILIHDTIEFVFDKVINRAFNTEVELTIGDKWSNDYSAEQLDTIIKQYKSRDYQSITHNVSHIVLTISYNTG